MPASPGVPSVRQTTVSRDGWAGRTEGPAPATDAADLIAGLEQIRERVHRWIDRIEERLDDGSLPPAAGGDLDRAARELEERREALQAEAERRDREWGSRLEALEHDRRLLADAWERLEREQLASVPAARVGTDPPATGLSATPPRAAPSGDEPESPVDRAILHQFETLRRDVRRKTESQRPR